MLKLGCLNYKKHDSSKAEKRSKKSRTPTSAEKEKPPSPTPASEQPIKPPDEPDQPLVNASPLRGRTAIPLDCANRGCSIDGIGMVGRAYPIRPSDIKKQKCQSEFTKKVPSCQLDKGELKERLTPLQYQVTQEQGTERAFSGKYYRAKAEGEYSCAVCRQSLFSSHTKYDSGSGWPAFWDVIDKERLIVKEDGSHLGGGNILLIAINPGLIRRTVSCAKCGSHLGHLFDDGPKPTGKRFCINSIALDFLPSNRPQLTSEIFDSQPVPPSVDCNGKLCFSPKIVAEPDWTQRSSVQAAKRSFLTEGHSASAEKDRTVAERNRTVTERSRLLDERSRTLDDNSRSIDEKTREIGERYLSAGAGRRSRNFEISDSVLSSTVKNRILYFNQRASSALPEGTEHNRLGRTTSLKTTSRERSYDRGCGRESHL